MLREAESRVKEAAEQVAKHGIAHKAQKAVTLAFSAAASSPISSCFSVPPFSKNETSSPMDLTSYKAR